MFRFRPVTCTLCKIAVIRVPGNGMNLFHVRYAPSRDGTVVAYRDFAGGGPPFVVAGGIGAPPIGVLANIASGLQFGHKFRRERRLIHFDWRGSGYSGPIKLPLEFEHLVDDIAAVVQAAGEPVHLQAWLGACIPASAYVARDPARVLSFTLRIPNRRGQLLLRRLPQVTTDAYEGALFYILRGGFDNDDMQAEQLVPAFLAAQPVATYREWERVIGSADLADYLPSVTVPVLIHTTPEVSEDSAQIAALRPGTRLTVSPGDVVNGPLGDTMRDDFDAFWADASRSAAGVNRPAGLSQREVEVLSFLARGATNRQIAAALVISLPTVATHVRHILAKLGCANRAEAAAHAIRLGLI